MKDVRELVKVRPLEWNYGGSGKYTAQGVNGKWIATYGDDFLCCSDDETAAQGICQEHHESRIYALLEPK